MSLYFLLFAKPLNLDLVTVVGRGKRDTRKQGVWASQS